MGFMPGPTFWGKVKNSNCSWFENTVNLGAYPKEREKLEIFLSWLELYSR